MKTSISIIFLLHSLQIGAQSKAPSHILYNRLLQKNVSKNGKVNYQSFAKDSVELNEYLNTLRSNPPDERSWSKNEQKAYWINAYNAFTIKLITKYYPIKSIKDIGSSIQVPFVNTPWDIKFIQIGKEKLDLNNIEHGILRKKFNDPRIHMALVCASKSCPVLLNEAYDPSRLSQQLDTQTRLFINDSYRNKIRGDNAQLSMIFKWYNGDFNKDGNSLISFINLYSSSKVKNDVKITYLEYDWSLNE